MTSLPKAGTHLLSRILDLSPGVTPYPVLLDQRTASRFKPATTGAVLIGVGNPQPVDREDFRRFLSSLRRGVYVTGHLPWTRELAEDLHELDYRIVALIRDPRDVVVSQVRYVSQLTRHPYYQRYRDLEFTEQVRLAVEGFTDSGLGVRDLRTRCLSILAWREQPGALVVRFEDLVGPSGGGTTDAQLGAVGAVLTQLGIDQDEARLRDIAARSFGGTRTFRKGRSGGWRDVLPIPSARLVEEHLGPVLGEMGYEPA